MRIALFATVVAAFLLGCGKSEERGSRTMLLGPGSTLELKTGTDGVTEISATIPPGRAGSGTYKSSEQSLTDQAREAKNALNEPGAEVRITVDDKDHIVAVELTRTKSK